MEKIKKKIKEKEKPKVEKKPKKVSKVKIETKPAPKKERFFEAVGRRKTSVARVRLFTRRVARATLQEGAAPDLVEEDKSSSPPFADAQVGEKLILVNEKPYNVYFPTLELQQIGKSALEKMKCLDRFRIIAKVKGGGFHSQAEALRHSIARALVLFNPDFKKRLKKAGYLTRDPRMRERKKFGLKRARRAPQWQKR